MALSVEVVSSASDLTRPTQQIRPPALRFPLVNLHRAAVAVVFSVGFGLVGCSSSSAGNPPGLANPASVYCVEQGGEVDIVDETDGQVGYCNLPDGTRVEEWELYRSSDSAP